MKLHNQMHDSLVNALSPVFLEVINESHGHRVAPGSETHFKVVAVSEKFEGLSRIARHRKINELLADALQNGVHALSLQLYTLNEWTARGGEIPSSPPCMGGSKKAKV